MRARVYMCVLYKYVCMYMCVLYLMTFVCVVYAVHLGVTEIMTRVLPLLYANKMKTGNKPTAYNVDYDSRSVEGGERGEGRGRGGGEGRGRGERGEDYLCCSS